MLDTRLISLTTPKFRVARYLTMWPFLILAWIRLFVSISLNAVMLPALLALMHHLENRQIWL